MNAKRQVILLLWRSNAERPISVSLSLASSTLSSSCPLERKDQEHVGRGRKCDGISIKLFIDVVIKEKSNP